MKFFEKYLPFIFIFIFSLVAIYPFTLSGFFPMHDDTQVARVFDMYKALVDGQFPVRWVADLGYHYGYPIFNFYAPFAYYVGGRLMVFGFDALAATKLMMAIGVLIAGFTMYFFAREIWGRTGGVISSLLYVYAPYHALNVYVRGAVGEFFAYAFIPLTFLGIYKIAHAKKRESLWKWVVVGAIGYALIIISHNLTALMVTPFLFAFVLLFFIRHPKSKRYLLFVTLGLGIVLSSFYWLPVLSEMHYTNVYSQVGGGSDYRDHFVCPMQLWDSQWGFGGSVPGCIDGLSFMIGKFHILLFVFALFCLVLFRKRDRDKAVFVIACVVSSFVSLFFLLQLSQFIWDSVPQMAFLQFPWRFLLLASFFVSFIAGASVYALREYSRFRIVFFGGLFVLTCIIVLFNQEVFVPQQYLSKSADDYIGTYNLWWNTSKISDEYLPQKFQKPKNFQEVPQEKIADNDVVHVAFQREKTQQMTADLEVTRDTDVLVRTAYFPGWQATVDAVPTSIKQSPNGMVIAVPQGRHSVVLTYHQTPIQVAGNVLSITGVLILILGIIKFVKSSSRKSSSK